MKNRSCQEVLFGFQNFVTVSNHNTNTQVGNAILDGNVRTLHASLPYERGLRLSKQSHINSHSIESSTNNNFDSYNLKNIFFITETS